MFGFTTFTTNRSVQILKGLISIAPIVLVLWLVNQNLLLTPGVSVHYRPGQTGGPIVPDARDGLTELRRSDGKRHWEFSGKQLRFSVFSPRGVRRVRVQAYLEPPPGRVTMVAQGTLQYGAQRTVLQDSFLNSLPWKYVSNGTFTLWRRGEPGAAGPAYGSVEEFLENPPTKGVAVRGLDPYLFYRVRGYEAQSTELVIPGPFRGNTTLLVYTGGEPLTFSFQKSDLNRIEGGDTLRMNVLFQGKQMVSKTVSDDGEELETGKLGEPQLGSIGIDKPAPGLYTVSFEASEDVLISQIRTKQHYLAFSTRIFLAGGPAYALPTISTQWIAQGTRMTLDTIHEEGNQTVSVGGTRVVLRNKDAPVEQKTSRARTTVDVPINDAVLTIDGLLTPAFAQPIQVSSVADIGIETSPSLDGIDYLLSDFVPGGQVSVLNIDQTYDASKLFFINHKFSFSIETNGGASTLHSIDATLYRGPLPWGKLWRTITGFLR